MPARGLVVRVGDEEGATATCSVAACICRGVRRQNAIESPPSRIGPDWPLAHNVMPFRPELHPTLQTAPELRPHERHLTAKIETKAKARTNVRAFRKMRPIGRPIRRLLDLLGLLFRPPEV